MVVSLSSTQYKEASYNNNNADPTNKIIHNKFPLDKQTSFATTAKEIIL